MLKKVTVGLMCLGMGVIAIASPASASVADSPKVEENLPTENSILTQTPRWTEITLTLDDLPAGFTAMPPSELANLKEQLRQDDINVENVFAFVGEEKFQLIMGIVTRLETQQQQEKFDEVLRDPEQLKSLLAENLDNSPVPPQPLSGVNNIGDAAAGVSLDVDLDSLLARLEILVFRKDQMGAFIFLLHQQGTTPSHSIGEIARTLDSRAAAALRSRPN